jgi:GT2 family glycosyltransferase
VRRARVAAVVPCFNRPDDARALLGDLARLSTTLAEVRVLLVDNASTAPLSALETPSGVDLEHLRLPTNSGGSGGYNAGMRRVLGLENASISELDATADQSMARWRDFQPDYVWLVDSDARVMPETLDALVRVLDADRGIIGAGAAIADPQTGRVFELGGHVNRRNGNYEPHVPGSAGVRGLVDCDYAAACCALVRADAIRATGVFPDTFLNGDDVEWFLRLKQRTRGRVVGVPWARAMHPRFDRFPTWTRYYTSRNSLGPLEALGLGRWLRLRRAATEVPRAVQQAMMGRSDLARLHVQGLKDAAVCRNRAMAAPGVIALQAQQPHVKLGAALREVLGDCRNRLARVQADLGLSTQERATILRELRNAGFRVEEEPAGLTCGLARNILGAVKRYVLGTGVTVSVVPARGRPEHWYTGKLQVQVAGGVFAIAKPTRVGTPLKALWTGVQAARHAIGCGLTPSRLLAGPSATDVEYSVARARDEGTPERLSLEVIVLSYNRWGALESTVRELMAMELFDTERGTRNRITVVDNGSTDGTPARLEELFPSVNLIKLEKNAGVEAFNIGAGKSGADVVLILDDDAVPERGALEAALNALARHPELGAVTLHPRHPSNGKSEWPFCSALKNAPTDAWPVMGCANIVRRKAWEQALGYESSFFLYRNDTDLALKLLSLGWGVRFDPALVVWHDTLAGTGRRKSVRWHELATRNWVFVCRRHGRAWSKLFGVGLGWAWAHALAGLSISRQGATLKGAMAGVFGKAPVFAGTQQDGSHLMRLLKMQVLTRGSRLPAHPGRVRQDSDRSAR